MDSRLQASINDSRFEFDNSTLDYISMSSKLTSKRGSGGSEGNFSLYL